MLCVRASYIFLCKTVFVINYLMFNSYMEFMAHMAIFSAAEDGKNGHLYLVGESMVQLQMVFYTFKAYDCVILWPLSESMLLLSSDLVLLQIIRTLLY